MSSQAIFIPVGAASQPRVALSTGIISGLGLLPDVGGTEFDIAAGRYQILDMSNINNITPTEFVVGAGDFVNQAVPNILTEDFTYVFLDNSGSLFLQNDPPDLDDVDNLVYLGNLTHTAGTLGDPTNLGWMAYNATLDENRRNFAEGTKRVTGLQFDFAGNLLAPDLSAGEVFRLGANRLTDETNPNTIAIAASTYGNNGGGLFTHLNVFSDGGTGVTIAGEANIDFTQFDDGSGALQLVGNNNYANHYFWLFPTTTGGYFMFHEYGKANYNMIDTAANAAANEPHLEFLEEAALVGVITGRNNVIDIEAALAANDARFFDGNSLANLFKN